MCVLACVWTVDAAPSSQGCDVIIVNDMVETGLSLFLIASKLRELGARRIIAFATHGVFVDGSHAVLAAAGLEQLVITNTVPIRKELALDPKIVQLSTAPLLASAIRRAHLNQSIASMRTYGQAPEKPRYVGQ